jgi:hypothetical protein
MIQERLRSEALNLGVPIIDGADAGDLTQDIVDEIVRRLDDTAHSTTT